MTDEEWHADHIAMGRPESQFCRVCTALFFTSLSPEAEKKIEELLSVPTDHCSSCGVPKRDGVCPINDYYGSC